MQGEAKLVKAIMKVVKETEPQAVVWKLADRFNRGLPDLLVMFPKDDVLCVLLVEVKSSKGKLSKLQEHLFGQLAHLRFFGNADIIVARSVEDVLSAMQMRSVDEQ